MFRSKTKTEKRKTKKMDMNLIAWPRGNKTPNKQRNNGMKWIKITLNWLLTTPNILCFLRFRLLCVFLLSFVSFLCELMNEKKKKMDKWAETRNAKAMKVNETKGIDAAALSKRSVILTKIEIVPIRGPRFKEDIRKKTNICWFSAAVNIHT